MASRSDGSETAARHQAAKSRDFVADPDICKTGVPLSDPAHFKGWLTWRKTTRAFDLEVVEILRQATRTGTAAMKVRSRRLLVQSER